MTATSAAPSRTWLQRFRRAWAFTGATAGLIFIGWFLLSARASETARRALISAPPVTVASADGYWRFDPQNARDIGLLFFPGALVDPVAYAPLARAVAARGYPVLLIQVPRRGAFGGAESPELADRYRRALRETLERGGPRRWVVAGHSRGGVISANVVRSRHDGIAGLVLIGTSHPRDFSIAHVQLPVTQVFGTRDTIADADKVERSRRNLPASTEIVRIDGGNHSQFAHYGFQPGDWPATISRDDQHRLTVEAVVATLERALTPR